METDEGKLNSELDEKIYQIYKDFLTRVTKLEELVAVGGRLLAGFQEGLEVHTCQLGLRDHLSKAKSILSGLECLLEDVTSAMQNVNGTLSPICIEDFGDGLNEQATTDGKEVASSQIQRPEGTDFAALMVFIYSMLKQDYVMQEKIVSALNFKLSSGELESYCLMWSLRPFVNDEIMHQAWKLIP